MNKLNKIGDNGQLCLTPRLIGNLSDSISRNLARAFDEKYKLERKSKHFPPIPKW